MQIVYFGLILRQQINYETLFFWPIILCYLCFWDSGLLFCSIVFSLFLLSPLFVGLHVVFLNDIVVALLMYLNKERTATLVPEISPSRIELYSYANNLFWFELKSNNHTF